MKGFLFLLLAIIFLLTIQIQTGVLGNQTTPAASSLVTATTTSRSSNKGSTKPTAKPAKSGVLALGDMGRGSFFFFLTSTLIHLFYHN
ncbi:PREDICTED: CAMPATH-1 antigen [Dipodomys ordii]|uniref:CAMPATH-1 antigen n=1 Tax=Dipodomys ordii TaxID=10020 RepID=A0A1S3GHU8_DIPOR|nr:PREDICTED: CAMPATH-1 antigen [Dipodomys ordii]